jgi:putative PIN family toxin of toxin-antitoxin system
MLIVFDTNIVVSAMLSPSGTAADVLRLALNRHVQLCASEVILEEYKEVLRRPKFRRPPQTVSAFLKAARVVAELFEPTATLAVSTDDADNRFLECAEAAKADYLATGNIQHFPVAWGRTRVITVRHLVELVTSSVDSGGRL